SEPVSIGSAPESSAPQPWEINRDHGFVNTRSIMFSGNESAVMSFSFSYTFFRPPNNGAAGSNNERKRDAPIPGFDIPAPSYMSAPVNTTIAALSADLARQRSLSASFSYGAAG